MNNVAIKVNCIGRVCVGLRVPLADVIGSEGGRSTLLRDQHMHSFYSKGNGHCTDDSGPSERDETGSILPRQPLSGRAS